ncbi:hypothetical protein [Dyadobacter linearis]|uniref:hypothetical protein n=1 Tax=Dyadobacter linearis TaxID=2823330 RepID=UPI001BFC7713|nr:hypothetical protein [Dyadobacter sp. CECT 9623]
MQVRKNTRFESGVNPSLARGVCDNLNTLSLTKKRFISFPINALRRNPGCVPAQ